MDTPVQAHSIKAASQFSEGRGCSFGTGVHPMSTCGEQGEKAAVAHDFIGHDNSRLGVGATISQGRRLLGLDSSGAISVQRL